MSRYFFTLNGPVDREKAMAVIRQAPAGTRVDVKAPRRTPGQNDRMWWLLTQIAQQLDWHGRKLRPDDWKIIFIAALSRESDLVPNLDGSGFVDLGRSSSDLSKTEMSDLMELIAAYGAQHGVIFPERDK
jgi:hypothetical protein